MRRPQKPVEPRDLNGIAALMAAESTYLRKKAGERDTEFVKRIVCAYLNAERNPTIARLG